MFGLHGDVPEVLQRNGGLSPQYPPIGYEAESTSDCLFLESRFQDLMMSQAEVFD